MRALERDFYVLGWPTSFETAAMCLSADFCRVARCHAKEKIDAKLVNIVTNMQLED